MLDYNQVVKTFPRTIIEETIRRSQFKRRIFMTLPPGRFTQKYTSEKVTLLPRVMFYQLDRELCLPCSIASALFIAGHKTSANLLYASCWMDNNLCNWQRAREWIKKLCPNLTIEAMEGLTVTDFIDVAKMNYIVIGLVLDLYLTTGHAFTTYAGVIYDSNSML